MDFLSSNSFLMLEKSAGFLWTKQAAITDNVANAETPNYKKKVLKANDIATMTTGKRLGHPVRQIKNQFAKDFLKAEYSQISDEELEKLGSGALYRAAVEGDEKTGDFLAGQIAGMVNKEQPAAEIIKEMFAEAEEVLKGAGKWVK